MIKKLLRDCLGQRVHIPAGQEDFSNFQFVQLKNLIAGGIQTENLQNVADQISR